MNETAMNTNELFNTSKALVDELRRRISQVVVVSGDRIDLLLMALISGGHVLIEDVPGTGKTTLASALSAACGLKFSRAQFTPDVTASDITGFNIYNRSTESFEFRPGIVMCNILLADEINRASPKTQSSLLEAMEEGRVTVDGVTYPIPEPFSVIATQNPVGFVGTYPLPEAQLDRFSVKVSLGYPSEAGEISILSSRLGRNPLDEITPVASAEQIMLMKRLAASVFIHRELYKYMVALVGATRRHSLLDLGASPRGTLILSKMAQVRAFMNGRTYVVPEDVAAVFIPVIAHRLIVKQTARLSGVSSASVLTEILRTTAVPNSEKDIKPDKNR